MKSLARLALVVSLMVSIGGHWGVLQAIAWARMLQNYSAEKGIVEGIKDTFSGERPCPLCHKIIESKKTGQNQSPAPKETTELLSKWFCNAETGACRMKACADEDASSARLGVISLMRSQWQTAPPTPPPRMGTGVLPC